MRVALAACLVLAACGGSTTPPDSGSFDDAGTDANVIADAGADSGECTVVLADNPVDLTCGPGGPCEGGTQACCWTDNGTCDVGTCVPNDSDTSACDSVIECLGYAGQCGAGSWCCESDRRCAPEGGCAQFWCAGRDIECPPSAPHCVMQSLEGIWLCQADP